MRKIALKVANACGIALWVVFSGALAIFLWGYVAPSIPFTDMFWEQPNTKTVHAKNSTDIVGVEISTRHILRPDIQCKVSSAVIDNGDGTGFTYTMVMVDTPADWSPFFTDRVRAGCTVFMDTELANLYNTIDHIQELE